MDWNLKKILVTGGASFISSHLIDHLVAKGARSIRVVDDLSSGRLANIQGHVDSGVVEFHEADLLAPSIQTCSGRSDAELCLVVLFD